MAMMTVGECPCGEVGTLVDGRCAFCERVSGVLSPAADRLTPRPRPLNDLMRAFLAELDEEGIPDPLGQPLTLGAVWLDLCRLAGEEPPAVLSVDLLYETAVPIAPAPAPAAPIRRGSYCDHGAQFPEVR